MADDYSGLKAAITAFLDAVPLDKGIMYQDEDSARLIRQLTQLFRSKCTAQGITL
jgi:hypothetical protein